MALPDNNVYYIEQAVDNYNGKCVLIKKQLIKTGINDIPSNYLPTILNKEKKSDFLADLLKARKEHAQSVNHSSTNNILNTEEKVNNNSKFFRHHQKVILDNVEIAKDIEVIAIFGTMYLAIRKNGILEGHYHNLGEKVKNLPNYLSNPLCIVEMNYNRLALISQLDADNKNGYISVELNTVKDINSKNKKYNLIVTLFESKDNYLKNILTKNGVSVKYEKSDLLQVNRQLHEWLGIVNNKSDSTNRILNTEEKVNNNLKNSSDTIKYSKKSRTLTDGQVKKKLANHTKLKVHQLLIILTL